MEFLRVIVMVVLLMIAGLLFISAGADAAIKCITDYACKNTYSQTAEYTICKETTFMTLIQKVRIEK